MSTKIPDHELALDHITVRFGGLTALDDVSLRVPAGRIVGVIGPNGAGKTTLFNVICGFVTPTAGEITLDGRAWRPRPHHLNRLGIARTLQGVGQFSGLTVLENVQVGIRNRHSRQPSERGWRESRHSGQPSERGEQGDWHSGEPSERGGQEGRHSGQPSEQGEHEGRHSGQPSRRGWRGGREKRSEQDALDALERCGAAEYAYEHPGALPYAIRKRIELARALASRPRILMLDEPAGGLDADEIQWLAGLIRDTDTTVLLVEHHMDLVMAVCDEILVLDFGKPIALGPPVEISANEKVTEAYLGAVA
ncbi:ABC transporter ATP-binding protein [Actinoplanes regularis]|uniref:Branched-chain amino acid transport system ATP-binding protein n=1 Tax=Actinoplanes regularis TaxID=52697 RepID=A0A238VA97_9ACTN|nr:ABC transporter ATP-binding protein [Actinoplanes regularis]GIE83753.1 ABC transporter ATP-binding protein [Actinoplanes regularis]SNR30479.1 branched-chain amino acid transport system ATP-binding protein [Actinoplanes regularis]